MSPFLVDSGGVPERNSAGAAFEVRLKGQVLAGLFCAGATLALLTVLLPHSSRANVLGLLAIVANAYVVAGLLFWRARAVSSSVLQAALAWGSTLITGVAYFSGSTPSPLVFFYLWVFLYSAYFFTRKEAALQIVYVGIAYAVLLVAAPPPSGLPAWWIVGMGSLLVAAILIAVMRGRSEELIERLYEAARTDPLTKLLNRRGFRELLDLELERSRRSGAPLALVVGDIDHFKEVNDRSGHAVGDAALRRAADLLSHGVRRIDAAARIGGEEFALVLPDVEDKPAYVLAERLRCALREEFAADTVAITISFGIASYPQHGETAGSLLRAADEALYAAKQAGRDRSVIHDPALSDHFVAGARTRNVEAERFVAVLVDLAETVDLRFSGSARHSETVGRYAEMMAEELGLSEQHVARVRLAGLLHDIGKIGVPDAILQKPGRLTDEEFAVIKKHPELGAQLLEHPGLTDVQTWVATHHERPDGRGYPRGISGDTVALEAQIVAVADAYEAMTSDRSYRRSIGHGAARTELRRCAGSQFAPHVVEAFLTILDRESRRAENLLAREASSPAEASSGELLAKILNPDEASGELRTSAAR
jgi:diguanylate cyclase (GGDEF)-like protein/putative nucleotidyltransferase with HDIG domain